LSPANTQTTFVIFSHCFAVPQQISALPKSTSRVGQLRQENGKGSIFVLTDFAQSTQPFMYAGWSRKGRSVAGVFIESKQLMQPQDSAPCMAKVRDKGASYYDP